MLGSIGAGEGKQQSARTVEELQHAMQMQLHPARRRTRAANRSSSGPLTGGWNARYIHMWHAPHCSLSCHSLPSFASLVCRCHTLAP